MIRSGHIDSFPRDNLPPADLWPEFTNLDTLGYPERLNAAADLIDRNLAAGRGDHPALVTLTYQWTYDELAEKVDRIANVLTNELGIVPGNRILIRSPNNPMMAAVYLAVIKVGAVAVGTMPLLRTKELIYILDKAQICLAICDARLMDDLQAAMAGAPVLQQIVAYGDIQDPNSLEFQMAAAEPTFTACDTASDDVCLIAFTSGTTGQPKGTMHFHRDLLAICDCSCGEIIRPEPDDRFIGSPPLAFTFGLGGLLLFPMSVGATAILIELAAPNKLLEAIAQLKATVCFTAPTAYRAMLPLVENSDLSSLKKCASAGENLPKATWDAWHAATGLRILDGIGATEMLHTFIASPDEEIKPGATGRPIPGFEAKIVGPDGENLAPGTPGRLAVRGPTGCRYLADDRQTVYVVDGWNLTGDTYLEDADGYFWFQARSDDMIITAGYNVAGPEVEGALLSHSAVVECGVVGAPDPERGQIVRAYVVLADGAAAGAELTKTLQDHVKAEISPYKYPRSISYVSQLPKTETGKLQRFKLRQMAAEGGTPA